MTAAQGAALLRSFRQALDESEVRQQQNLQLRIGEVTRDFDLQRRQDLVQVEQGFGRCRDAAAGDARRPIRRVLAGSSAAVTQGSAAGTCSSASSTWRPWRRRPVPRAAAQAPAAAAHPHPTPPAPERVRQGAADARYKVRVMEGVLEKSVQQAALRLNEQLQRVSPDLIQLAGAAHARGYRLEGYGLFFDVEVPAAMRQTMGWTARVMRQQHEGVSEALGALKRITGELDPKDRAEAERAMRQIELAVRPVPRGRAGLAIGRWATALPSAAPMERLDVHGRRRAPGRTRRRQADDRRRAAVRGGRPARGAAPTWPTRIRSAKR